jgi:hypothetical protein
MMFDVRVHSAVQAGGAFAMEKQERAGLLKRMLFQIAPGDNIENVTTPRRDEGRSRLIEALLPPKQVCRKSRKAGIKS